MLLLRPCHGVPCLELSSHVLFFMPFVVTPCHAHAMPCSAMPCHVQACGAACRAMPTLHSTAAAHSTLPSALPTAHVQAKDATVTFKDIAGIDQVRPAFRCGHRPCFLLPRSSAVKRHVRHGRHGNHGSAACLQYLLLSAMHQSPCRSCRCKQGSLLTSAAWQYPTEPELTAFHHLQVKEEIMEIVSFLRDPQRFLTLGARSPAGVLLVGAPGAYGLARVVRHAVAASCAVWAVQHCFHAG